MVALDWVDLTNVASGIFISSVTGSILKPYKLVSPFRKPINQHFLVYLFDLVHPLIESSLVAWLWLTIPGM